jgi:hypothetical protein
MVWLAWLICNPAKIETTLLKETIERKNELSNMVMIAELKNNLGDTSYIVFNASAVRLGGQIPIMFFTRHSAYDFIPNPSELNTAQQTGYPIAIIDDGKLPSVILNDHSIRKIKHDSTNNQLVYQ